MEVALKPSLQIHRMRTVGLANGLVVFWVAWTWAKLAVGNLAMPLFRIWVTDGTRTVGFVVKIENATHLCRKVRSEYGTWQSASAIWETKAV